MPVSGFGYRDASRAPGRNERTPRSSNRPPAVKVSSTRLPCYLWCNLTIPVLRQPGHVLDTLDLPSQHLLDRLDQAVCDPACELVEWHELVALGVGARGDALLFEGVARPDIAERLATESGTRCRPYGCEAFDQGGPESENVNALRAVLRL